MKATLTYVHHSSFVLHAGERSFLFDFPGPDHFVDGALEAMLQAIRGRDLFVLHSHSHADHFHPQVRDLTTTAARVWYVLSDDIPDMHPEALGGGTLVVEPDETYEFMGLTIETLMSNDLGVAFLLRTDGLSVYYGGDLGNWNWDSDPVRQRKATERFFAAALQRIASRPVDIAFTNADKRLRSQCGAAQFVRSVRPRVFVPMHTHGHLDWLADLREPAAESGSMLFEYDGPGYSKTFEL